MVDLEPLGENLSSRLMGEILQALHFLPSVTLKESDSWRECGEYAERAGLTGIEVLLRSSYAEKGVRQLKESFPQLKVGLGTVLSVGDFERAQNCGADFVVSPGMLPVLLEKARSASFAYLPGVMTPSEIMTVSAMGFWNAKLFPAAYLHEAFIKAIEGPFPHMRYCASGGVTAENWPAYALCASVLTISGTWILPNKSLESTLAQSFVSKLMENHMKFVSLRQSLATDSALKA